MTISRRALLQGVPAALAASALPKVWANSLEKEVFADIVRLGNQQFSFDMYKQLVTDNAGENVFFSPLSLSFALAMTMEGTVRRTATELQQGLFGKSGDEFDAKVVRESMGKVMKSLNAEKSYELNIANAIWMEKTFPVNDDFVARLKSSYESGIELADFVENPEEERARINDWAEKTTKGKIKDLLTEGTIKDVTRFVLANAIFFKADWMNQFEKKLTRKAPFTTADGKKSKVDMMSLGIRPQLQYAEIKEVGGFKMLRMPYQSDAVSMIVCLPNEHDGLPKLEAAFAQGKMNQWTRQMRRVEVDVRFPKFKLETDYTLNPTLKAMGMASMFRGGLDGMSSDPFEGSNLFVSLVKQKAFVEVDEEGTEAAAATAVVVFTEAAIRPQYFTFHADRPFLFMLRDKKTDSLLFVGRYVKPELNEA